MFVCTLAIQTAGSRLVFSMARDGKLPASALLAAGPPAARHADRGRPSLIGGLAVGVLAVNIGNAALFTTLSSVCIVMIYLAYLLVTVPLLVSRLRGAGRTADQTDAGRAVLAGTLGAPRQHPRRRATAPLMVVNLSWPRAEIYDPSGDNPLLLFSAAALVGAVLLLGVWSRPDVACFPARPHDPQRPHDRSLTRPQWTTLRTTSAAEPAPTPAPSTGGRPTRCRCVPASGLADAAVRRRAGASLTWAETVAVRPVHHMVLARGTRLRLTDTDGDACVHLLLFRAGAPLRADQRRRHREGAVAGLPRAGPPAALRRRPGDGDRRRRLLRAARRPHRHHHARGEHRASTVRVRPQSASPAGRELLTARRPLKHGIGQRDVPPSVSFFQGVRGRARTARSSSPGRAGAGTAVDLLLHMARCSCWPTPPTRWTRGRLHRQRRRHRRVARAAGSRSPCRRRPRIEPGPEHLLALQNTEHDLTARTSA